LESRLNPCLGIGYGSDVSQHSAPVSIHLFGPLRVERDGRVIALPASRKTRAILGFLALSPRPVSRQRLCDLFFDTPTIPGLRSGGA
jgi:hypothetical protein